MMPCGAVSAAFGAIATRRRAATRRLALTGLWSGATGLALCVVASCVHAANAPSPASPGMQPLADDELAAVRGADGVAFNLSNFSLTSIPSNPLSLTYLSPGGSSLTLSGLDLSRTDDPDPFADPYVLSLKPRGAGLPDMIAIDFPLNTAGNQRWSLTADFAHCDAVTAGACTGTNFLGGTMQVLDLTMKGGGLTVAPTALADTQGIAFGLGTQLDIASLSVYSRGRDADGTIDKSDTLALSGIHLADARTGGAWMLADLDRHPGLLNAQTGIDPATGLPSSYLHIQVGWPTTADPVPAASLRIDNITFSTTPAGGGAPVLTNLGSVSVASLQINYVDIKFRTGQ